MDKKKCQHCGAVGVWWYDGLLNRGVCQPCVNKGKKPE
jgi:hypothetical protein